MRLIGALSIVLANLVEISIAQSADCPNIASCSSTTSDQQINPCCMPWPGGLFIFRERLQLDEADELGNWGIDGLSVLDCVTRQAITSNPFSPSYTAAEISSMCLRSRGFGGEAGVSRAEQEWAYREAGEGIEELWETAWGESGRYISTLSPECTQSEQEGGVPLFFDSLHKLHTRFTVSALLSEADIIPSSDTTYSLSEIEDSLSVDGFNVTVTCIDDALSLVSWPLLVQGKFQSGDFIPYPDLSALSLKSNCPAEGIRYPSLVHHPAPKPSEKWDPIFRPQPRAVTKSHDESRMYHSPIPEPSAPMQLGFFKIRDQGREGKGDNLKKQFSRDEL